MASPMDMFDLEYYWLLNKWKFKFKLLHSEIVYISKSFKYLWDTNHFFWVKLSDSQLVDVFSNTC